MVWISRSKNEDIGSFIAEKKKTNLDNDQAFSRK
jgi:hypothetical protein